MKNVITKGLKIGGIWLSIVILSTILLLYLSIRFEREASVLYMILNSVLFATQFVFFFLVYKILNNVKKLYSEKDIWCFTSPLTIFLVALSFSALFSMLFLKAVSLLCDAPASWQTIFRLSAIIAIGGDICVCMSWGANKIVKQFVEDAFSLEEIDISEDFTED